LRTLAVLIFVILAGVVDSPSSPQAPSVTVAGVASVVRAAGAGSRKTDSAGVVVWLKPVLLANGTPHTEENSPARRFKIVQRRKRFEPRLLAVPVHAVVDFPNLDPFFHNVFSLFDGKRFDLGLYEAGASQSVTFDRPGVSYIFCNIHPEMSALVVVTDTPLYAISDAAGKFSIPGVPPGRYLVSVWHERAKAESPVDSTRLVTVSPEKNGLLPPIRLIDSGQIPAPHKNKYGLDYDTPKRVGPPYK
jgi:plastocyanin